jgi:putative alpha-1,2-mannosidase
LGNGREFTVIAKDVSAENKYVVAAELNGQALNRAWFRHSEISNGGKLVLTMAAKPGKWPTGEPPPSFR